MPGKCSFFLAPGVLYGWRITIVQLQRYLANTSGSSIQVAPQFMWLIGHSPACGAPCMGAMA